MQITNENYLVKRGIPYILGLTIISILSIGGTKLYFNMKHNEYLAQKKLDKEIFNNEMELIKINIAKQKEIEDKKPTDIQKELAETLSINPAWLAFQTKNIHNNVKYYDRNGKEIKNGN